MTAKYSAEELVVFATSLLEKAGLESDKSKTVAEILVEGDLLGHDTHGLHLLAPYLNDISNGAMNKGGAPRVIADFPAAVTWDGQRLPGAWLTVQAIDLAIDRAAKNGACSVSIRRSHHIACLAAYLKRATDQGFMILLTSSDPRAKSVAPYGGLREVFTPNPIAAAWPTDGDPVMLDVSMSITTNGMTKRLYDEGRKFPGPWAIDSCGSVSDDPAILFANPAGTLLPIGGVDHGHKGYALALLVEALTSGLGGYGRADAVEEWTANVFLQVFDPALFGGRDDFLRQTSWLAQACRNTPPRPGVERVRLPGETGLRRRNAQLENGVALYHSIMPALVPWAEKFDVPPPRRVG